MTPPLATIVKRIVLWNRLVPRDVEVDVLDYVESTDVRVRLWTWPEPYRYHDRSKYRWQDFIVTEAEVERASRVHEYRELLDDIYGRIRLALLLLFPQPPPTFRIRPRDPRRLTSRAKP